MVHLPALRPVASFVGMDLPVFTVVCDTCHNQSKWATYREAAEAAAKHRAAYPSHDPKILASDS